MAEALVADASIWLAIFLQEKGSEKWVDSLSDAPLFAPDLLPYELVNGVLRAQRRKRIESESFGDELLLRLPDLEVTWVPKKQWWAEALRIARQREVTIYDAAYIAVAKTEKTNFCSLDEKQLLAAKNERLLLLTL
jgi:predicted nucleic acid-binding protein